MSPSVSGFAELTLETVDLREAGVDVRGPVEHPGGDRSIYFTDPAGNVVEAWDFFERRDGVEALTWAAPSRIRANGESPPTLYLVGERQ